MIAAFTFDNLENYEQIEFVPLSLISEWLHLYAQPSIVVQPKNEITKQIYMYKPCKFFSCVCVLLCCVHI